MHGYTRVFLATLTGLSSLVCAFDVLVDPFDVFQWVSVPGWNAAKYVKGGREEKALALRLDRYDALVIGTSRAEVGYRLDHPAWGGRRVYAATLSGTNMYELGYVYDYAVRRQSVDTIVFGLDFLMFGGERTTGRGFGASGFDPAGSAISLPQVTLSLFALRESFQNLRLNRRGVIPAYTKGHRDGRRTFGPTLAEVGHARLFERTIRDFLRDPTLYYKYHYGQDRVDRLRAVVEHSRAHGIRLLLVINPAHALELETIRAAGLASTFERWKEDMVRVAAAAPGGAVPLWDFTGYGGPPAEALPPDDDHTSRMTWYFDMSHFTEALGDRVLDRVLRDTEAVGEEGFGVRIDPSNLAAHLERIRADREGYVRLFPREEERVRRILARVQREASATPETDE